MVSKRISCLSRYHYNARVPIRDERNNSNNNNNNSSKNNNRTNEQNRIGAYLWLRSDLFVRTFRTSNPDGDGSTHTTVVSIDTRNQGATAIPSSAINGQWQEDCSAASETETNTQAARPRGSAMVSTCTSHQWGDIDRLLFVCTTSQRDGNCVNDVDTCVLLMCFGTL